MFLLVRHSNFCETEQDSSDTKVALAHVAACAASERACARNLCERLGALASTVPPYDSMLCQSVCFHLTKVEASCRVRAQHCLCWRWLSSTRSS